MLKPTVLLTCPEMLTSEGLHYLEEVFDLYVGTCSLDDKALVQAISGVQGYILGGLEKVSYEVVKNADCLAWITFLGVQWETFFDPEARDLIRQRNIPVYSMRGVNAQSVANYTITQIADYLRDHRRPCTVGVLGAGNIGQRVIGKLLEMPEVQQVVYYRRSPLDNDHRKLHFVPELQEAFNADIITVHLAVVPGETQGIIQAQHLKKIRPDGLFINSARAELLNSPRDLLDFLVLRPDVKAVWDVFWVEGCRYERLEQDDPEGMLTRIKAQKNFIFTGHKAGIDPEAFTRELLEIIKQNNLLFT